MLLFKRLLAAVLCATLLLAQGGDTDARSLVPVPLGSAGFHGPGSKGFLSLAASTFAIANILKQSNSFTTTPWSAAGSGAVAPTVTANNQTAPDGTTTASTVAFPAVGGGQFSLLLQLTTSLATLPYTADIYVRGAVGGETLWLSSTATGVAGSYTRTAMVLTTGWQRIPLSWINKAAAQFLEIGVDTRDTGQAAQAAQTIYICNAQLVQSSYEWPYVATTTAAVTQNQVTPLPPGIAFRDFSPLRPVAGNPVLAQNSGTYNANGTTTDYFNRSIKIGSAYYAMSSGDVSGGTWNNIILNSGTGPLTMADVGSGTNPILSHTAAAWDDHYLLHAKLVPVGAQFYLYYSAMDSTGKSGIGVAISSSITGPYTKYVSNPIIKVTSGNIAFASLPHVITIGNQLVMYTAVNNNSGNVILIYTSPVADGLVWTFAGIALNPAIPSVDWESGVGTLSGTIDPFVFLNSHGYYEMAYTGFFSSPQAQQLGYAISLDGFKWFKYNPAAIVVPNSVQSGATQIYVGDPVFDQDGTKFTVLFDSANGTNSANALASQMADA